MAKAIPKIQKYMTAMPETVDAATTIADAAKRMRELDIRHFPVMSGERLAGIISERDVLIIEGLQGVDPQKVVVEDAMTPDPYAVSPDASIQDVAQTMAANKYGSAVVVQNGRVVGVFTTTDACRVLAEVWDTRLK